MNELISVVIPCYNAEKTIEKCLNSLLVQTYANIEIIVVDDGSSDNTCKLVRKYAETDGRIFLLSRKNSGVSATRNAGIDRSQGEFISFVDADDYVEREFLKNLFDAITNCDVSICYYSSRIDDVKGTGAEKTVDDIIREMMVPQENIAAFVWNRLYKTSIIRKHAIRFDENVYACEDTLFNFEYMQHVKSVGICKEYLYHYEINTSSAMFGEKFNERKITANIAFDYMLNKAKGKTYEKSVEVAAMWFNLILKRQIYKSDYIPTQMQKKTINRMLSLNPRAFMNAPISAKYKLAYPFWKVR